MKWELIKIRKNEETSSFVPPSTKKKKASLVDVVSVEMMSIKNGLDAVAATLDRGNVCNYTEEQLLEAISVIGRMNATSEMKLYEALSRDVNDA